MFRVRHLAVTLLFLAIPPVLADKGPESTLNRLFAALHGTENQAEGSRLTSLIWQIWNHPADPETAVLMTEGREALEKLDFGTAEKRFNRVIGRAPAMAEGWNKRATLYYVMGRFEASIRDIRRVLQLEPRHFGALAGLGMNYDALGYKHKALNAWRKALEANPHLEDAPNRILQLEAELGRQTI